jgi:hypothetical protein
MKLEFLGTGNAFSKTKGPSCAIMRLKEARDGKPSTDILIESSSKLHMDTL